MHYKTTKQLHITILTPSSVKIFKYKLSVSKEFEELKEMFELVEIL